MSKRRFDVFTSTPSPETVGQLERAYPGYTAGRTLGAITSIVNELCYGPVWTGRPMTIDAWRRQSVPAARFAGLADVDSRTALSLDEACDLLAVAMQAHDVRPPLTEAIPRPTVGGMAYDAWLASRNDYPRRAVVDALIKHVRETAPPFIESVLLHGSAADGLVVDGYSDLDAYFILRMPANGTELRDGLEWLLRCNAYFMAFNPCAHHGPMLVLASALKQCSDALFPAAVVEHGVWVHGQPPAAVFDLPSRYDAIAVFAGFEPFFEEQMTRATDVRSAFDALWWTSGGLLLPVLIAQLVERRSVWKRDVLTNPGPSLPGAFHPVVTELSAVRQRLGAWIATRLPADPWPTGEDNPLLPGVGLAYYKQVLAMTDADRAAVGITDALMLPVRMLWEYCAATALETHRGELGRAGVTPPSRFDSWPHQVTERPLNVTADAYTVARDAYVTTAATVPGVVAIYEFGTVGCPGLSDLDLLVVLEDDVRGVPEPLRADAQPAHVRQVLVHDPMFVARAAAPLVGAVFPLFAIAHVHGEPLSIPLTSTFPTDVRSLVYTSATSTKYPDDLIWLTKEPVTKWTRVLAYAHSFRHVATCLRDMGAEVPAAVNECAAFSDGVRSRFAASGVATTQDLRVAAALALRAAAEAVGTFEMYWRGQFPHLAAGLPPFDPSTYTAAVERSRESDPNVFPPRLPALSLVRAACTGATVRASTDVTDAVRQRVSAYVRRKAQFIEIETTAGREVSRYIHETIPE